MPAAFTIGVVTCCNPKFWLLIALRYFDALLSGACVRYYGSKLGAALQDFIALDFRKPLRASGRLLAYPIFVEQWRKGVAE